MSDRKLRNIFLFGSRASSTWAPIFFFLIDLGHCYLIFHGHVQFMSISVHIGFLKNQVFDLVEDI